MTSRIALPQHQNLLKYSEDFTQSGTWAQTHIASVAANQIANPRNGLINVSGLIADSTSTGHWIQQNITFTLGLTYTVSVYAKAGNQSWLLLEDNAGSPAFAYFNLTAGSGAVGSTAHSSATIQALPNGWYLCSMTYAPTLASNILYVQTATGNGLVIFAGDNVTINTYLYGAMVTQSAGITAYTPTTSSIISGGSERLLVPQLQNLIKNSQDITQATWANDATSTESTYTGVDPTGATSTFSKLVCAGGGYQYVRLSGYNIAGSVAGTYTISCWAMTTAGGSQNMRFYLVGQFGSNIAVNGTWQRISFTITTGVSASATLISNDASNDALSVYLYGIQVVQANYPGPLQITGASAVNIGPIRSIAKNRLSLPTTQNILPYSEAFTSWTTIGTTVTANSIANPVNGAVTASLVQIGAGANQGLSYTSLPYNTRAYTFSVYARAQTGTATIRLRTPLIVGQSVNVSANIPLTTAWQLISITTNVIGTGLSSVLIINDSGNSAQNVYLFGAQLVQANWIPPYQVTSGTAVNNGAVRSIAK